MSLTITSIVTDCRPDSRAVSPTQLYHPHVKVSGILHITILYNYLRVSKLLITTIVVCFQHQANIKIYRTIILPVILYGCETWLLTLGEERRLRVFENRVLRRIFWPKRDEVAGEWRKLHNEELNDLYCSPNFVRVIKSRRMR